MSKKVEQTVEELTAGLIEQMGYELADVEFAKEGGNHVLTLFIDKPGGVSIDDCEKVSVAVDPILDEADPISQAYYLSVSSLGLDRPLKKPRDFERKMGAEVTVHLYAPLNKKKQYTGVLRAYDGEHIELEVEGEEMQFDCKAVSAVKPFIKF